jgi:hypothetical protein
MNDIEPEMIFQLVERSKAMREEHAAITAKLEVQRARITVALGYLKSNMPGIAALILAGDADDKEVTP